MVSQPLPEPLRPVYAPKRHDGFPERTGFLLRNGKNTNLLSGCTGLQKM